MSHGVFEACEKCGCLQWGIVLGDGIVTAVCTSCYHEVVLAGKTVEDEEDLQVDLPCTCGDPDFGIPHIEGTKLVVDCECGNQVTINDPNVTGLPNSEFLPNSKLAPSIINRRAPSLEEDNILARIESQFDVHTDHEGGDLYSDAKHDFIVCPACRGLCNPWMDSSEECDGRGNEKPEGDED